MYRVVSFLLLVHFCVGLNNSGILEVCDERISCLLPDCFCPNNTKGPDDIPLQQRPQIIILAFNDAVNDNNFNTYMELLKSEWINPNGCPIGLTLLVSDTWTNYTQLQQLWLAGAEVAAFGKYGFGNTQDFYRFITKENLLKEIGGQKDNFVKKGRIPPEYIRGFRMPYFAAGGDDMFNGLQDFGYDYDSSLLVNRSSMDSPPTWPSTLDHKWPFLCRFGSHCPMSNHSSFWEVPLQLVFDVNATGECQYIEACPEPKNQDEAFQLIWRNFLPYQRNRTPFVLNLKSTWFNINYQKQAFKKVMYSFMTMKEVYIVSMSQLVDWMKNTTSLDDLMTFEPWGCGTKRELLSESSPISNPHIICTLTFTFILCYVHTF